MFDMQDSRAADLGAGGASRGMTSAPSTECPPMPTGARRPTRTTTSSPNGSPKLARKRRLLGRSPESRNDWWSCADRRLDPPEWVEWMDELVPGYPKRPVPRDERCRQGPQETDMDEPLITPGGSGSPMHTTPFDAAVPAAYDWRDGRDSSPWDTPAERVTRRGGDTGCSGGRERWRLSPAFA